MSTFIKTERFKKETLDMMSEKRSQYIKEHLAWVSQLKDAGENIASGYLVNDVGKAGGGGFLVIEANDFNQARLIIMNDPMIKNHLVNWEIHQWIPIQGELLNQRG